MESIEMSANVTEMKTGDSVQISCKAVGEPKLFVYQWRKDGTLLFNQNPDLLVQKATQNDSGFYECFVKNEFGILSSGVSIMVFGEYSSLEKWE